MRLINTSTYQFKEVYDEWNIEYAVLSHRWRDGQEILYKDMKSDKRLKEAKETAKFDKIRACCRQAASDGLQYVWIDTCCIDKSSSAELQESINSMFRWYQAAKICYAYLFDVSEPINGEVNIHNSEWFKRGWTLQELLAPHEVVFYSCNWVNIGSRSALRQEISSITGIPNFTLESRFANHHKNSVAEIMSWANGRQTSRLEDRAYSLLGLFNVHMPLLYGEGDAAFIRLQEEILKRSNDHSIFAWTGLTSQTTGTLAPSPDFFSQSPDLHYEGINKGHLCGPSSISSLGTSIMLTMMPWAPGIYLGVLNYDVIFRNDIDDKIYCWNHGIFLEPMQTLDTTQHLFRRLRYCDKDLWLGCAIELRRQMLVTDGRPIQLELPSGRVIPTGFGSGLGPVSTSGGHNYLLKAL